MGLRFLGSTLSILASPAKRTQVHQVETQAWTRGLLQAHGFETDRPRIEDDASSRKPGVVRAGRRPKTSGEAIIHRLSSCPVFAAQHVLHPRVGGSSRLPQPSNGPLLRHRLLEPADVEKARVVLWFAAEVPPLEGVVDLQRALRHAPLRAEPQDLCDLAAVHVVAALELARHSVALHVGLDAAVLLEYLGDPVRELQYPVVLVHQIERLAPDLAGWHVEQVDVGVHGVADVQQRAPDLAAAPDRDELVTPGLQDEGVDHQVEAHPGREAEDGALAQDHRAEVLVLLRYLKELDLREALGLAVVGRRGDRQLLGHHLDVHVLGHRGRVVDRATGGEEEAHLALLLLRLLGDGPSYLPRGLHVGLAVQLGREVGCRVVGEPRQVDDRVHVLQHRRGVAVAEVLPYDVQPVVGGQVVAEPVRVHHAHRLAQGQKLPDEHAADVPGAARNQYHARTTSRSNNRRNFASDRNTYRRAHYINFDRLCTIRADPAARRLRILVVDNPWPLLVG